MLIIAQALIGRIGVATYNVVGDLMRPNWGWPRALL